jgi:hypothetical protein
LITFTRAAPGRTARSRLIFVAIIFADSAYHWYLGLEWFGVWRRDNGLGRHRSASLVAAALRYARSGVPNGVGAVERSGLVWSTMYSRRFGTASEILPE